MIPKAVKMHYSRDFKISLIISLSFIVSLFLFFPHDFGGRKTSSINDSIIFSASDIPPTIQSAEIQKSAMHIPPTPAILIPSDIEEPELLSDVSITTNSSENNLSGTGNIASTDKGEAASSLPFVPRQILEVMPKKVDKNVEGYIRLSLKIGIDGKVESYIVLVNTTNCSQCLQNVLIAVHKSRWQPATVNGSKIEYWVEKSYNFN